MKKHTLTAFCSSAGLMLALLALCNSGCRAPQVFTHDVDTEAKPWTHTAFQNDPNAFQFAIVADRTGGHRAGIFPSAIDKLNLLRPEFVMTVGDMIEGYITDEETLRTQWAEFNGFVRGMEAPFFYVPGNHDNVNPAMKRVYAEMFGRAYYSFVYKNALFLCLDSQAQAPPALDEEQVRWALSTLDSHADVRWTFVFMHQPLWVYEEGDLTTARKHIREGHDTGFGRIQEAMQGRDYTVFAGHFHQYIKYVRHQQNHLILGTTGGASQLRGPAFGEFDHAVWVTLTPKGPVLANLMLDGIRDDSIHTEEDLRFRHGLGFAPLRIDTLASPFQVRLPIGNPFGHVLSVELAWDLPADGDWEVSPATTSTAVPTGQDAELVFDLRYSGNDTYPVFPTCTAYFSAGHEFSPQDPSVFKLPLDNYLMSVRPTMIADRAATPPVVDGNLSDVTWQKDPLPTDFRMISMDTPSVRTEAWLAYDTHHLYVAMQCHEPNMAGLRTATVDRDGSVWEDDSVEVMIAPRYGEKTYRQVAVNSIGTIYDGQEFNRDYNMEVRAAAATNTSSWSVEMAIPWDGLGIESPEPGTRLGLLLVRTRTQEEGILQYPPLHTGNHTPERYGFLELGE